jgi:hypothetical protein
MVKSVKLFLISGLILLAPLIFLSYIAGSQSYAQQQQQQPPTDFFLLECNEIKSEVNALLNSKGSVQQNLIAIKNMTFLVHLYTDKCSTGS